MTLCENAKQDSLKVAQEKSQERAKAILYWTPKALAAVQKCLGAKIKPSDLLWDTEDNWAIAAVELEGRRWLIRRGYGDIWHVSTTMMKPKDEYITVKGLFKDKRVLSTVMKETEVKIYRPADLVEAGICNG